MTTLATIKAFLLRERTLGRAPARSPRRRRRNRQRGVAIVAVMIAIALTLVISDEFGTSTNVDLMAAANYRDQMRAHFLARSATNLSELVIRVQQRIDNVQQLRDSGIRITDFADQVLLAFCGNPEEVQAAIGLSSSDAKGLGADWDRGTPPRRMANGWCWCGLSRAIRSVCCSCARWTTLLAPREGS